VNVIEERYCDHAPETSG